MTNSRDKGKRGELEVVHLLQDHGFVDAHRGQQYKGTEDSPDVVCKTLPLPCHIEVKLRQKLNIEKALVQSETEAQDKAIPVVFHRSNREEWKVTLRASVFLEIMASLLTEVTATLSEHQPAQEKVT